MGRDLLFVSQHGGTAPRRRAEGYKTTGVLLRLRAVGAIHACLSCLWHLLHPLNPLHLLHPLHLSHPLHLLAPVAPIGVDLRRYSW